MSSLSTDPAAPPRASAPQPAWRMAPVLATVGIALVLFTWALVSYPKAWNDRPILTGARSHMAAVFSERFEASGTYRVPLRHFDALPPDIAPALLPRDAALVDGEMVPRDFAGTVMVTTAIALVWQPLASLLSPLFGALTALAVGFLAYELARRRGVAGSKAAWAAPAGALLFAVHPGLTPVVSNPFSGDAINMATLVGGSLLFVRVMDRGRSRDYLLMAAAFAVAVFVRYPSLVFALPLLAWPLLSRRIPFRTVASSVTATFAPVGGVILAFNAILYGSPFRTGYHVGDELARATANIQSAGVLPFEFRVAVRHGIFYLIRHPAVFVPAVAGCLLLLVHARRRDRPLGVLFVASVGFTLLTVGIPTWGSSAPAVTSSFVRYSLPMIGIWSAALAAAAVPAWGTRRAKASVGAVALLVVSVSVWTMVWGPRGVTDRLNTADRVAAITDQVVDATPPDSIVVTRHYDVALFPERQTLTLAYLAQNEEPVLLGVRDFWDVRPTSVRFASVSATIVREGISLYLVGDIPRKTESSYRKALRARALGLTRIEGGPVRLYRIAPIVADETNGGGRGGAPA